MLFQASSPDTASPWSSSNSFSSDHWLRLFCHRVRREKCDRAIPRFPFFPTVLALALFAAISLSKAQSPQRLFHTSFRQIDLLSVPIFPMVLVGLPVGEKFPADRHGPTHVLEPLPFPRADLACRGRKFWAGGPCPIIKAVLKFGIIAFIQITTSFRHGRFAFLFGHWGFLERGENFLQNRPFQKCYFLGVHPKIGGQRGSENSARPDDSPPLS